MGQEKCIHRPDNRAELCFRALGENEAFARMTASAFVTRLDPTLEELQDMKTAVSEAVTNAIIHGYEGQDGTIVMRLCLSGRELTIEIADEGVGIENIARAREPLFTTKPEQERSGMGFAFMEAFMDSVEVHSQPGAGTTVIMRKCFSAGLPGKEG